MAKTPNNGNLAPHEIEYAAGASGALHHRSLHQPMIDSVMLVSVKLPYFHCTEATAS